MRKILGACALISLVGCASVPSNVSESAPYQTSIIAVYSAAEINAIGKALVIYTQNNAEALSKYKPVVDQGTILNPGVLQGQSYRPGSAMLRQLGYLSFDAPQAEAWIDPPPAGCVKTRCTMVMHVKTNQSYQRYYHQY